jgi:hypothetical protein
VDGESKKIVFTSGATEKLALRTRFENSLLSTRFKKIKKIHIFRAKKVQRTLYKLLDFWWNMVSVISSMRLTASVTPLSMVSLFAMHWKSDAMVTRIITNPGTSGICSILSDFFFKMGPDLRLIMPEIQLWPVSWDTLRTGNLGTF